MSLSESAKAARRFRLPAAAVALLLLATAFASAADFRPDRTNNRGVVEIETGGSAGGAVRIITDLASLINDGATRRVLPVVGESAMQNLQDLALLRGIDMAVLQADVVDSVRQQRTLGGVESTFTYVTQLNNEEFHLLARADVKALGDLANRKVNVGIRGSGSEFTAGRLFGLLKIAVVAVNDSQDLALDKLQRGDIDAMAFVTAKPAALFANLRRDVGLHFLAVPVDPAVINAYVPTTLTAGDYPALIKGDEPVNTVAVGTILAVAQLQPGGERYRNVSGLVDVFFTEFRSLLEPGYSPKWREINLATELPGWRRFPPAQAWLDRNRAVARQAPQELKALFSKFVESRQQVIGATPLSEQQKQDLFDQFQHWQSSQPTR